MTTRNLLASLAVAVFVSACAVVDVGETCATYSDVQVPAMPTGAGSLATEFSVKDLGPFASLASSGFTLSFTRAEVRTTSGIDSLDFVRDASLAVASGNPASSLPKIQVLACDDCDVGSGGDTLVVTGSGGSIAGAPYVASGSLAVTVGLVGKVPAVAWTMDVDVCMSGSAAFSL